MDVSEAQAWIDGLRSFGIKPGLERVEAVLNAMSNPHHRLRFFHVAGTNGKGSVCAMLSTMLQGMGLRVGLYTSPGIGGNNGRVLLNDEPIPDALFAQMVSLIRVSAETVLQDDALTEYEVWTLLAILYYDRERVDAVVWETGLGGRFDATNVVTPLVTAITNVTYDHEHLLGPTLSDIAWHKAGIIKDGIPVVTAAEGEAYAVIVQVAAAHRAKVIRVGTDISVTRTGVEDTVQNVFYRGLYRDIYGVRLSLYGMYQLKNAAIALTMLEFVYGHDDTRLMMGVALLSKTVWASRFEVLRHGERHVVIDGAHNPAAAGELARSLERFSREQKIASPWRMLIGVLADKDWAHMLDLVLPLAREVVICRPNHIRGADPLDLAQYVQRKFPHISVRVASDVEVATTVAIQDAHALVIWGSLYMVEDARKTISKLEMDKWT